MVRSITYKTNVGPPVSWEGLAGELGQVATGAGVIGKCIAQNKANKNRAANVVKADEKKGATKPKKSMAVPDGKASERITPKKDPFLY